VAERWSFSIVIDVPDLGSLPVKVNNDDCLTFVNSNRGGP